MRQVTFHRVIKAPVERVYKAFLDADALAKWLPPNGFTGHVHHMDATVGGGYKMTFTQLATGYTHTFSSTFLTLIPQELICHTDTFDDPALLGEMKTTIRFSAVSCGTEIHITQEGIPEPIPLDGCYIGWQESLYLLSLLVEANI